VEHLQAAENLWFEFEIDHDFISVAAA
jgi:hypothetical protein